MTQSTRRYRSSVVIVLLFMGVVCSGCVREQKPVLYKNPYSRPMNLAVVPFRNLSGSPDMDVMAATDEFYSELQQVEGFDVMPVNRVISTLRELGLDRVEEPDDVYLLAQALSVDGVIVGSITRYNPYPPPEAGMVIQMYLLEERPDAETITFVDPGELARSAKPFRLNEVKLARPSGMVVRIFDARQDDVKRRIRSYAASRGGPGTPYSWQRYTTRRNYLRFVSYEMIGELLAREAGRFSGEAENTSWPETDNVEDRLSP